MELHPGVQEELMKHITRTGLSALLVLGCAGFADDAVWMQQKSVAIGSADFKQCVSTAVSSVPGVAVNRAVQSSAAKVPLDLALSKSIPFLDAEVQHRGGNQAVIVFSGKGKTEPPQDRKQVDPLVQSLADAITAKCGAAKP